MKITEVILASGHRNILATHKTTFEITKEDQLSKRGDCIIAVATNKALADLSPEFKKKLRKEKAKITITIEVGGSEEVVHASGSPRLLLTHPRDIVVRKSNYVCARTLAIRADKAACGLSRNLVERLKNPNQEMKITLTVKV